MAHVRMLGDTNIVAPALAQEVLQALAKIRTEIPNSGNNLLAPEDRDIHASIHRRLSELIGRDADLVNIGISRNDQIATDIRLWLRDNLIDILSKVWDLRELLVNLAARDLEIVMPGYTHMQPAMPIRLSLWWLANESRLQRDFERLMDCYKRLNISPLGACQIAGTNLPIDREMTARNLGFDQVMENSLDATSDRDYVIEFSSVAAMLGVHVSQMSSELLLWATQEFGFVRLPRAFVFRSQSMPQKRNPELLEILRSRPAVLVGRLTQFLSELKGLCVSYSQDLQESLPGLIESASDVRFLLELTQVLLPALNFDAVRMRETAARDMTSAANVVDYLVERGFANEKAAKIVESCVSYCRERNRQLVDLTLNEWALFSPAFDEQVYNYLNLEESIDNRSSLGGSSGEQIEMALARRKSLLEDEGKALSKLAAKRLNCREA
jgi:argininosuccinate lyase